MLFFVGNNDNRQSLGRQFHFVRRIGTGGFGEVYLAEMSTASGFAKMVAIKLLRSELSGNENVAERMRDEARLLGMLQHRTIVQAEDLISISGRVAVVMEFVPGCNWSAVVHPEINKQPIPPRVVLDMVHHVSNALDVAFHRPSSVTGKALGVLHRDIKPGNIRLTPDGEFKVLDFGIARGEGIEREAHTTEYQLGSLNYMAPELLVGNQATPATDIYGLGVTFFESLARDRYGWAGESEALHQQKLESRVAELDFSGFGELADDVRNLLMRMMAHDPSVRPLPSELATITKDLEHKAGGLDTEGYCKVVVDNLSEVEEVLESEGGEFTGRIVFEDDSSVMSVSVAGAVFMDDQTIAIPGPGGTAAKGKRRGPRTSDIVILLLLFAVTAMVAWTQRMQKDTDHGSGVRMDMVPPKAEEVENPTEGGN
jgi:serine/threonine protein kinase